jgi:hypothetical protein
MSATVRDNILFCHEFEQEYYDLVLDGMLFLRVSLKFLTIFSLCITTGLGLVGRWRYDRGWRKR